MRTIAFGYAEWPEHPGAMAAWSPSRLRFHGFSESCGSRVANQRFWRSSSSRPLRDANTARAACGASVAVGPTHW